MISNVEEWYHLAPISLSSLFGGITPTRNYDFCCLNCFHTFRIKNKFQSHKEACEKKDFCRVELPYSSKLMREV